MEKLPVNLFRPLADPSTSKQFTVVRAFQSLRDQLILRDAVEQIDLFSVQMTVVSPTLPDFYETALFQTKPGHHRFLANYADKTTLSLSLTNLTNDSLYCAVTEVGSTLPVNAHTFFKPYESGNVTLDARTSQKMILSTAVARLFNVTVSGTMNITDTAMEPVTTQDTTLQLSRAKWTVASVAFVLKNVHEKFNLNYFEARSEMKLMGLQRVEVKSDSGLELAFEFHDKDTFNFILTAIRDHFGLQHETFQLYNDKNVLWLTGHFITGIAEQALTFGDLKKNKEFSSRLNLKLPGMGDFLKSSLDSQEDKSNKLKRVSAEQEPKSKDEDERVEDWKTERWNAYFKREAEVGGWTYVPDEEYVPVSTESKATSAFHPSVPKSAFPSVPKSAFPGAPFSVDPKKSSGSSSSNSSSSAAHASPPVSTDFPWSSYASGLSSSPFFQPPQTTESGSALSDRIRQDAEDEMLLRVAGYNADMASSADVSSSSKLDDDFYDCKPDLNRDAELQQITKAIVNSSAQSSTQPSAAQSSAEPSAPPPSRVHTPKPLRASPPVTNHSALDDLPMGFQFSSNSDKSDWRNTTFQFPSNSDKSDWRNTIPVLPLSKTIIGGKFALTDYSPMLSSACQTELEVATCEITNKISTLSHTVEQVNAWFRRKSVFFQLGRRHELIPEEKEMTTETCMTCKQSVRRIILPCRHGNWCETHLKELKNCPICDTFIRSFLLLPV